MSTRLKLNEMRKEVNYYANLDNTHWVSLGALSSTKKWCFQIHEGRDVNKDTCLIISAWCYATPEKALEAALKWFGENVEVTG